MYDESGLPSPHPAFAAHFTNPVYEDVADGLAPFGSDLGSDVLAEWANRRDELGVSTTVGDVLDADPADFLASRDPDDAQSVQAAGFTLLRLVGHIDPAGRLATLAALDILISHFGPSPGLLQQRDDLSDWSTAG